MSGMIQDILSSQVAIADEDEDEMCVKVSFKVILEQEMSADTKS